MIRDAIHSRKVIAQDDPLPADKQNLTPDCLNLQKVVHINYTSEGVILFPFKLDNPIWVIKLALINNCFL